MKQKIKKNTTGNKVSEGEKKMIKEVGKGGEKQLKGTKTRKEKGRNGIGKKGKGEEKGGRGKLQRHWVGK